MKSLISEDADYAAVVLNDLVVKVTVESSDGYRKLLVTPSLRLKKHQLPSGALARFNIVICNAEFALIEMPCCSNITICSARFTLLDVLS